MRLWLRSRNICEVIINKCITRKIKLDAEYKFCGVQFELVDTLIE